MPVAGYTKLEAKVIAFRPRGELFLQNLRFGLVCGRPAVLKISVILL